MPQAKPAVSREPGSTLLSIYIWAARRRTDNRRPPREADADAVGENGREGDLFGSGPVDGSFVRIVQHLHPLLPHSLELSMDGKLGRQARRDMLVSRSFARETAVSTFDAAPGGGASGCGSTKSCSGFSASERLCSWAMTVRADASAAVLAALDERPCPDFADGRMARSADT